MALMAPHGDLHLGRAKVSASRVTSTASGGRKTYSVDLVAWLDRVRIAVEPNELDDLIADLTDASEWLKARR